MIDFTRMSDTNWIKTLLGNPTESRQFFREKIVDLVNELKELKEYIAERVEESNKIQPELDRIFSRECIKLSKEYNDYVNKQKELKKIQHDFKLSLSAFGTERQTGFRKDTNAENLNTAKRRSIIDVAGMYVEIKNNKASCPFHSEKEPSLHFYPKDNGFYCFGCKAAGDVISFIMLIENKSFSEAIDVLIK